MTLNTISNGESGSSVRTNINEAFGAILGTGQTSLSAGTVTAAGSTTARSLAARFADIANVKDFGALCDSSTDDSTAFQNALNSGASCVMAPPSTGSNKYVVHDVTIPNGVTLLAHGAYFLDKTGADHIFKLTGTAPGLDGAYISDASHCATAAIIIDDGTYELLQDITIVNATSGVRMQSSTNGANGFGCSRATLHRVRIDTFTGTGLYVGPNVHDGSFVDVYLEAGQASGTGGYIPKAGTTGYALVGTGSTVAYGGNQFINCVVLDAETGLKCTDSNLDNFVNFIADGISGAGIWLSGSSNKMLFTNPFIGVAGTAILSSGASCASNRFVGLYTSSIGEIPATGGTNFFSSGGYSAPFYELTQTAGYLTIDANSWSAFGANAHTLSETNAGYIQLTGGIIIPFNSNGTVAAGSTVYLGLNGQSATEGNVELVPTVYSSIAMAARVVCFCDVAPGAGQTFTYTLRINQGNSTISGTTSGGAATSATMSGANNAVSPNQSVDIKLVTSAAAAAATHRGYIQLIPQPS